MPSSPPGDVLCHLRRSMVAVDPGGACLAGATGFLGDDPAALRLGLPHVDAALQGGLAGGALHELAPAAPAQLGAAAGFALALAALTAADGQAVLVIQTDFAVLETGTLYGPGLECFGLALERLVMLRVPRPLDLLGAFEEALKSSAVAATVAELPEAGAGADLTATRRLALAARAGGGLGLLLRHKPSALPSAAMTRWEVAAALSQPDRLGGLGRTAFDLSLTRNRRGRCGRFIVCWDHHERTFSLPPALSLGLAAAAGDRSADARAYAG